VVNYSGLVAIDLYAPAARQLTGRRLPIRELEPKAGVQAVADAKQLPSLSSVGSVLFQPNKQLLYQAEKTTVKID
jgi:hypothetical protein